MIFICFLYSLLSSLFSPLSNFSPLSPFPLSLSHFPLLSPPPHYLCIPPISSAYSFPSILVLVSSLDSFYPFCASPVKELEEISYLGTFTRIDPCQNTKFRLCLKTVTSVGIGSNLYVFLKI